MIPPPQKTSSPPFLSPALATNRSQGPEASSSPFFIKSPISCPHFNTFKLSLSLSLKNIQYSVSCQFGIHGLFFFLTYSLHHNRSYILLCFFMFSHRSSSSNSLSLQNPIQQYPPPSQIYLHSLRHPLPPPPPPYFSPALPRQ